MIVLLALGWNKCKCFAIVVALTLEQAYTRISSVQQSITHARVDDVQSITDSVPHLDIQHTEKI
jgi:hypothetical protein